MMRGKLIDDMIHLIYARHSETHVRLSHRHHRGYCKSAPWMRVSNAMDGELNTSM